MNNLTFKLKVMVLSRSTGVVGYVYVNGINEIDKNAWMILFVEGEK